MPQLLASKEGVHEALSPVSVDAHSKWFDIADDALQQSASVSLDTEGLEPTGPLQSALSQVSPFNPSSAFIQITRHIGELLRPSFRQANGCTPNCFPGWRWSGVFSRWAPLRRARENLLLPLNGERCFFKMGFP